MAAQWNNFDASDERPAWCCDLTEDGSGYVATIEIPGEPNLVLIAPACRAWQGWDGNISTARKNAELTRLGTRLATLTSELGAIDVKLTTAIAAETTLKLDVETAGLAYAADQTAANQAAYDAAVTALQSKQVEITNLRFRRVTLSSQIAKVNLQIISWSARPAIDDPVYGDGVLTGRQVMSPAQAYFNAAILPGWQKYKPTYRWGTASNVNYTANTMTVTLASAVSSAQGLNVNAATTLSAVPVEYMTCNAGAFENGDRVVVKFRQQDQAQPAVIGFVDNPKACEPWPDYITMDLVFSTQSPYYGGDASAIFAWVTSVGNACGVDLAMISFMNFIAPEATHNIRLLEPKFHDDSDNVLFDIVVDGGTFGAELWSGTSSAYGFLVHGSSGVVPIGGNAAQSVETPTTGNDDYIRVINRTNPNLTNGSWPTSVMIDCTPLGNYSGYAWIGSAIADTVTDVIYQRIDTWLTSIGAMPVLKAKRKNSTRTATYEYSARDRIVSTAPGTLNSTVTWRMWFGRAAS